MDLATAQPAGFAHAEYSRPPLLARTCCVFDGDPIDVDIELRFYAWVKKQRIRLFGIDAPEVKDDARPEVLAATEHLKAMIEGESIIVGTVKGNEGGDSDGLLRTLAPND